jgi:hypothetical protein
MIKLWARLSAWVLVLIIGIVVGVLLTRFLSTDLLQLLTGNAPLRFNATVILDRVVQLQQLTTIRQNYALTITSERDMPPPLRALYGQSLLFVAVGHVEAGIDLAQLTEANIVTTGDTVQITLPSPTLFNCFLDENQSYIVQRNDGVFAPRNPQIDNETRRYAISQIREAALTNEILQQAAQEAEVTLSELGVILGAGQVEIVQAPINTNALILPPTCGG